MATKWACVGPGKISWDFFLAIRNCLPAKDHEFVAVASRSIEKAQKFADEFKFQRAYGSYDELSKDKDVEVVYIGTIHTTHVELSVKMLEAGKHVICEKPMAMNLKEARKVFDAAKKNNRVFVEAIWSRWFPATQQIRKELESGSLGQVNLVQASLCLPIKDVDRIKDAELGGGGLLDIGIYPVQFACMVFKEMPESITASGILSDKGDVDIGACITLKYKNGAMANLTYHTNAGLGNRTACIMGTKGMIQVPAPFWCSEEVITPSGHHNFPLKHDERSYHVNSSGLAYEAASLRETIISGKLQDDMCTLGDSELIISIMDEVRRQIGLVYPSFD